MVRTVAPREGRVSRNDKGARQLEQKLVAPREGRVSRNDLASFYNISQDVAPREGRVSRKFYIWFPLLPLMYVLSRFIAGLREND